MAGPTYADIRIKGEIFSRIEVQLLRPPAFSALMQLLYFSASFRIGGYYSLPTDGGLPKDDLHLARLCRIEIPAWRRIKKDVLQFLIERGDKLYFKEDWVEINGGWERPSVPASVRMAIMRRDNWTCVYCGTTEGPFDLDHIVPVSRNGSAIAEENLVCACRPCNRDKRAKTPEEWISR